MAPADSSRSGRAGGGRASHRFRAERAETELAQHLVDERVTGNPWLPEAAGEARRTSPSAGMSYVVVDEVIDATATLRVTPWPVVDDRGRLRFPNRAAGFVVSVDTGVLRRQADERREVSRPVRVGDVFLVLDDIAAVRWAASPITSWDLIDVSAAARDAVKAQHFAAVAPVLDESEVWMLYRDLAPEDDSPQEPGDAGI